MDKHTGKNRVAVIGGGASGMMAAITAARAGASVMLLEHTDRVGKKILSTGNGKCNYTNRYMDASCYRSDVPDFPMQVIEQFSTEDTISFFEGLGIVPQEKNGYLYPASGQANSVLDVLRNALETEQVQVLTGTAVKEILPLRRGFRIVTDGGNRTADCVILACGSKAAPKTGSDGSGYVLAESLGHRIIRPLPALVQLRCAETFWKRVSGVRTEGCVSLFAESHKGPALLAADRGELQLTDYGISGIPVFQVSRFASRALAERKKVFCELDFWPAAKEESFFGMLSARQKMLSGLPMREFFTGWFNRKLADLFLSLEHIGAEEETGSISQERLYGLGKRIRHFRTDITGTNSFDQCQVCSGGVDLRDVQPETMESLLVPGLYFAGEILDVDGICGGYNLQWAWSSGHMAGLAASGSQL